MIHKDPVRRAAYVKRYCAINAVTIREYQRRYRAAHREEYRGYSKRWKRDNPDKVLSDGRRRDLMRKYGMSVPEFFKMLSAQRNRCAMCRTKEPRGNGNFHVDHCHKTGKVRGLLCHKCNVGLGHFDDSLKRLRQAVEYLRGTK